jgi:hypothetical protein
MRKFVTASFCARCGGPFKMENGETLKGVATKRGVVHWSTVACVKYERLRIKGCLLPIDEKVVKGL